jgi:hypothetical protein
MDPINHPYHVDAQRKPLDVVNTHQQVVITSKESYAWILTVIIGITVALIARFVQVCISTLCEIRNQKVQDLIQPSLNNTASDSTPTYIVSTYPFSKPFAFFVAWNVCFAFVGGILTAGLNHIPTPI